jgi:hypothetical protein
MSLGQSFWCTCHLSCNCHRFSFRYCNEQRRLGFQGGHRVLWTRQLRDDGMEAEHESGYPLATRSLALSGGGDKLCGWMRGYGGRS